MSVAVLIAAGYGCSSSSSGNSNNGDDGGPTTDASKDSGKKDTGGPGDDGGGDDGGGGCPTPADVSGFTPPAYKHAKQSAGACTSAFIDAFYNDCLAANATTQTCAVWGTGADQAHKTCEACLVTASNAAQYGALVEYKGLVSANVAGCMEIEQGKPTCAMAYQANDLCQHAACDSVCAVTDNASFQLWQQCAQAAEAGGCKTLATGAACADAAAEAGPAAACFAGQTFQDLYTAVGNIFCGGVSDAGGGG
jgi:hypothetical protein